MNDTSVSASTQDACVMAEQENHIEWLTLNQPNKRNALSSSMIATLSNALTRAYNNPQTRVIVLTANGPVFSAGHDLSEISPIDGETNDKRDQRIRTLLSKCADMMMGIVNAPKPVIASVQGTATAAGCQLVSACDLAIAASDAHFCTPGVNIGIFCTTPLVGIGRNIARKHAMEMALTGDMYSAEQAERFGLINRHVEKPLLRQETKQLAEKIAARSAQGIKLGKAAFYHQIDLPLAEAFAYANESMHCSITSGGDADEGRNAFLEKRAPKWGDA